MQDDLSSIVTGQPAAVKADVPSNSPGSGVRAVDFETVREFAILLQLVHLE